MKPQGVPSRTRHRIITYLTVGVGLSVSYFLLRGTTWSGSMQLHTLMDAVATLLVLTVGMLSLVRYYSKRDTMFLIIGVGFLGTGLLDGSGEPLRTIGTHTDISDRKEAESRVEKLAHLDELTGLPNRRLFMDRLKQVLAAAIRHGQYGAVLFLDLDNFKMINDSLGHPVGDTLLQQVANRLDSQFRSEDTVARLGGDEFIVLLPRLGEDMERAAINAQIVAEKLQGTLTRPFLLRGQRYQINGSIGVFVFPDAGDSADDIVKRADTAMYQSKGSGKNAIRYYKSSMQAAADSRLALAKDLRIALDRSELFMHYQPQFDSVSGQILGAEALLRRHSPDRGLVSPAEFIPVAEESRLILDIGQWFMDRVVSRAAGWEKAGWLSSGESVSINVSPNQFHQPRFVEQVRDAIQRCGVSPESIELEITEGVVMRNVSDTIEKMEKLKGMGLHLSLGDFGTGYSSPSYLKRLPLDQIKIDRSFARDITTDPNDAAIVETIISMARHMNLGVVAERVETEDQLAFLRARGCTVIQGYYFSRPVAPAEFQGMLEKQCSRVSGAESA